MMHRSATTQITGLSNSGSGGTGGTWNTAVDLSAFVTVPSGATAAVIMAMNTDTVLRYLGVRATGSSTPIVQYNADAQSHYTWIVPITAGNEIDIYVESASTGLFYVLGFCSSDWTFFDLDSAPYFPITDPQATVSAIDTELPAYATAVCVGLQREWRPVGESVNQNLGGTSSPLANTALVKTDVNGQISLYSPSVAIKVLGYTTVGVSWTNWLYVPETMTHDDTWRTGPSSNPGKSFAYLIADDVNIFAGLAVRGGADSLSISTPLRHGSQGRFAPLDDGEYQYRGEEIVYPAAPHADYYVAAWIAEATDTGSATVTPDAAALASAVSVGGTVGLAPGLTTTQAVKVAWIAWQPSQTKIVGRAPSFPSDTVSPPRPVLALEGYEPEVVTVTGPVAQPDPASVTIYGRALALGRLRSVAPRLPESTPTDNDLTPTILKGTSDFAGTPAVGHVDLLGWPPEIVQDGTTFLRMPAMVPKLLTTGLVPTLDFPVTYDPRVPFWARADVIGRTPTLLKERAIEAGVAALVMRGSVTTSGTDYSWRTVELAGTAVWTDIARAT